MFVCNRIARHLRFGAVLLALGTTAACDDPIDVDDEPEVTTIRVTATRPGGQTETISVTANSQSPATVNLPSGTTITAAFLRADGSVETLVNANDFELRVAPVTSGVTFTRTGPFAGTLNASTAGTKTVNLELFHLEEGHPELTFPLTFTT